MQPVSTRDQKFLDQLREKILAHLSSESFGVSELSEEIGMSRSNLLRKVKKITGLSVAQFIREVRLERAMAILKEGTLNVSEVSGAVGFGSTSYFVKCFREQYGYPPGEVGKQVEVESEVPAVNSNRKITGWLAFVGVLLVVISAYLFFNNRSEATENIEKSIAVLPFKNDSNDSSNVYLINGLMESTLNNLQKIADLRVLSRTSSEKYRNSTKSIIEIAEELDVNYFVEGSGQKIGERIMLNIQLIEASTDRQLWAAQFERNDDDIFSLQQEIASSIANEIKAIITPTAQRQISKVPTTNLLAYDNFLKGKNILNYSFQDEMLAAIPYFKKAIELDEEFAEAYAHMTFAYYYVDLFKSNQQYTEEMNSNAQKAMELDPELPESHVAMALCERQRGNFVAAVKYLEEALELNPNSAEVINLLSDIYANYLPNTEKYLEYALRGIRLNNTANDSLMTSYIYLHLSNALIQNGFIEESIYYVDRSLDYSQNNGYSSFVKTFMLYAREKDIAKLQQRLIAEWQKDSSRIDILQEVGKVSFFKRDFETAYHYYQILLKEREERGLDVYRYENLKIGIVYERMGEVETAQALIDDYYEYAVNDDSFYKDVFMYAYYAYKGDEQMAIKHLKLFTELDNYQYWFILFEDDPTSDNLSNVVEIDSLWQIVVDKFWKNHHRFRNELQEQGLI